MHQGRLYLYFLSIDTTFYDDLDWELMPHDPNQLFPFIRSFVNGHVWPLKEGNGLFLSQSASVLSLNVTIVQQLMLGYRTGVSWMAKGSLRKWRDAAIVETRF